LYLHGWYGVQKNYQQARYWLELAAKQGEAKAYVPLGFMHFLGLGYKRSEKVGITWFKKGLALAPLGARRSMVEGIVGGYYYHQLSQQDGKNQTTIAK
jgi:TPR repeat protein